MSMITLQTHVSDIVKILPKSGDVFRKLRIDYCCGGKIPLETAAHNRGLEGEEVLALIHEIEAKQESYENATPSSMDEQSLIEYITTKHHAFLKEELPALTPYVTKVARVHGERDPHLLQVQQIFRSLKQELLEHTEDEDMNVFPLILSYKKQPSEELAALLRPHVSNLEAEHEAAGVLLKELRNITNGFTPPPEACGTYRLVYNRLEALEKDTFDHIHLENHVLFEQVRSIL